MTHPHGEGPPISMLDDLLEAIRHRLEVVGALRVTPGDGRIEWLIGERYEQQEGAPPRIFVLLDQDGALGPPHKLGGGYIAGITERCKFLIWGAETPADGDRYRAAKAILVRLVNAIRASAPGRVKGLRITRGDTPAIVSYGEEYQLSMEYLWPVPVDARIWAVPTTPVAPTDPDRPHGDTGNEFDVQVPAQGSR
jgi:hypothetical protein